MSTRDDAFPAEALFKVVDRSKYESLKDGHGAAMVYSHRRVPQAPLLLS